MLGFEEMSAVARDVMAQQHDAATMSSYWEERGVPFEGIQQLAAGFAHQSVISIGRAARDRERVAAIVVTAMKVGAALGWELRGVVAAQRGG